MRARGVTCLSVDEASMNTSKAEFTTVVASAHERNTLVMESKGRRGFLEGPRQARRLASPSSKGEENNQESERDGRVGFILP